MMPIHAKEFLDTVFDYLNDGEFVCVSRATEKKDGSGVWFKSFKRDARQFRKWNPETQAQAWYFCVSTVSGELNEKGTMVGRGRRHLRRYHCLVLDDIGTKGTPPPVEPSWKILTSPDNYQYGYILEPGDDWPRYEALLEYCHQQGWGDAGAGGSYRLMRVPGSANLKPGRQECRSVVEDWTLDMWSLEELIEDLGCDFSTVDVKDKQDVTNREGGAVAMDGIDPLLDWLADAKLVVRDDGAEWVTITCPWADTHTTGESTAGYSPLGRGAGKYVQTRAFNCLHEHCREKHLAAFREWATGRGGPSVAGFDPLPWLQARYVYVETGQKVIDLAQRPVGGVWQWELSDWKLRHPGRITPPGRDNPVAIATAFIEDDRTRKAVDTIYRPVSVERDVGTVEEYGQSYVNTYVPPNWTETDEIPEVFLEHIEFLVKNPDEREIFLNWLAYKIQHPASRSYGVVMVAEDTYGTGRSWLKDMLSAVVQGGVNTATLPQLYGKGTSAEQTYNDWQSGCQYLVVEEAKDTGLTRDDFYHGYTTFKLYCDTKVSKNVRINPKFGRTRHENVYYNVLIFTNHADAMVLPDNDRRVFVLENPSEIKDYAYYDRLVGALQTQEPRRVYWWLMRRDVSKYDQIYPPMTPAKARMIEDNRAPSDAIAEWLLDNHAPDIVTRASLKVAIIMAARDLDDERTMREPGNITKILWRKLRSLRPEDAKNGARYVIDGKQTEVRAIRFQEKWVEQDVTRDTEIVLKELGKAAGPTNVVDFRGA